MRGPWDLEVVCRAHPVYYLDLQLILRKYGVKGVSFQEKLMGRYRFLTREKMPVFDSGLEGISGCLVTIGTQDIPSEHTARTAPLLKPTCDFGKWSLTAWYGK